MSCARAGALALAQQSASAHAMLGHERVRTIPVDGYQRRSWRARRVVEDRACPARSWPSLRCLAGARGFLYDCRMRISILVASLTALVLACSQHSDAAPSAADTKPAPQAPPVAAAPAPAVPAAELGKAAPDFTLTDTDGAKHHLADYRGKIVVLEWFNADCPFSKFAHTHGELKDTARQVMRDDLVWFSINSSAPGKQGNGLDRNKQAKSDYAVPNAILLDENGATGRAYGALKTPHVFIVDKGGVLVYRGAIDNAPMGEVDPARPRMPGSEDGKLINYVKAALEDLQASKPLRLSETAAYGCTVKYSN
jgi:peroxiredoxin